MARSPRSELAVPSGKSFNTSPAYPQSLALPGGQITPELGQFSSSKISCHPKYSDCRNSEYAHAPPHIIPCRGGTVGASRHPVFPALSQSSGKSCRENKNLRPLFEKMRLLLEIRVEGAMSAPPLRQLRAKHKCTRGKILDRNSSSRSSDSVEGAKRGPPTEAGRIFKGGSALTRERPCNLGDSIAIGKIV
jgi:hypothetical protein